MANKPLWMAGGADANDVLARYKDCSFAPGILNAYLDGLRRSHSLAQCEMNRIYAEAATDPVKLNLLLKATF